MKSGLHMSEGVAVGVKAPGSPEAKAAIERAGRDLHGDKWKPGTVERAKSKPEPVARTANCIECNAVISLASIRCQRCAHLNYWARQRGEAA